MEDGSVTTVAVVDEKTRWRTIPTACLHDLPSCPLACRVPCRADMHDFPTAVMNNEKDVDCPEQDRLNAEEVTGPDLLSMGGEKTAPVRRWLSSMDASHILRDGPRRDLETQLDQLRLDTFLSPQEVLSCHAANERLHFRRNRFSSQSSSRSRAPAPVGFPSPTVPSQHRSGRHDQKRFSPARVPPRCQNPEPTIRVLQSWPRTPSLQNQKLLTKAKIFSNQ